MNLPVRAILLFGLTGVGIAINAHADQPPLSGGEFAVTRATIDSGGAESTGGAFTVRGTTGQADTAWVQGGEFLVRSGFWSTPGVVSELIFNDSFETVLLRLPAQR